MVILPTIVFVGMLTDQALRVGEDLESWLAENTAADGALAKAVEQSEVYQKLLPYQDQIVEKGTQLAEQIASVVAGKLADFAQGTAEFFMMLFITLYSMLYFLKDGGKIMRWVFACTPLTEVDQKKMTETFTSVTRATLKTKLIIGIVQGGLAGAAFAVAGIENVLFWSAIMAVLSLLPAVGTALIWIPAVIYLAINGQIEAAIGVAVWCVAVVGTADNVLQPILMSKDAGLPDLMVMLTTFGGLVLFGPVGLVIGPVIGALFITIWNLWGESVEGAQAVLIQEEATCE
jgi:predicted PurR-regulated permease PerM